MTSIEKCLQHWENVQQKRKEDIKDIIKELDEICQTNPFNYSMFENRMYDLRRLRVDVEHIAWFITSMEYHKTLDKTWIETTSNCSQLHLSDEQIEKFADEELGNIRTDFDFGVIQGMKWYREKIKNNNGTSN
jgi:Asp-tRNA(Asn)/Glu-tRNA(Gln) amidotransferase C subunit